MPVAQGIGIDLFDSESKSYTLVTGEDVAKDSESRENARYFITYWSFARLCSVI